MSGNKPGERIKCGFSGIKPEIFSIMYGVSEITNRFLVLKTVVLSIKPEVFGINPGVPKTILEFPGLNPEFLDINKSFSYLKPEFCN